MHLVCVKATRGIGLCLPCLVKVRQLSGMSSVHHSCVTRHARPRLKQVESGGTQQQSCTQLTALIDLFVFFYTHGAYHPSKIDIDININISKSGCSIVVAGVSFFNLNNTIKIYCSGQGLAGPR